MKEQLISFETAKLAKEKGFDINDTKFVHFISELHTDTLFPRDSYSMSKGEIKEYFSACTQSLLQKWIREKHGIEIMITPNYIYTVFPLSRMLTALDKLDKDQTINLLDLASETEYKTYEEALEVALVEALNMI